ncbi:MAG: DUF2459 domain-containing protein [Candidatus Competibacteraceae bacterium]
MLPVVNPLPPDNPGKPIYLVHNGWHSGIVVQVSDLPAFALPERADFPNARYLEMGWGDRDFYQARSIDAWAALKAAFLPTASVVHMVGFNAQVTQYFPGVNIVEFRLSPAAMDRLTRYLHDSIDRGDAARVSALGPGLYGLSRFYPAKGNFHLFNTCHVWTAGAMRASGYPFSSMPSDETLLVQAMRLGRSDLETTSTLP